MRHSAMIRVNVKEDEDGFIEWLETIQDMDLVESVIVAGATARAVGVLYLGETRKDAIMISWTVPIRYVTVATSIIPLRDLSDKIANRIANRWFDHDYYDNWVPPEGTGLPSGRSKSPEDEVKQNNQIGVATRPGPKTNPDYIEGYRRVYIDGEDKKTVVDDLLKRWKLEQVERGFDPDASTLSEERKRINSGIRHQFRKHRN